MTTLDHTQTTASAGTNLDGTKTKRIGFFRIAAYTVAFIGMVSAFAVAELSQSRFAPQIQRDFVQQSELRSLLCRIDRRCPAVVQTAENTARAAHIER
jgi:hypothetical protein